MVTKRIKFSNQIRSAIDASGTSRYAICKRIALQQSTMSRFMSGELGLSMEVLDRLAALLNFSLHVERDDTTDKGPKAKEKKVRR